MNTTNKIETLELNFDEIANANETFTGSKELNISDEYPTKFVFAYNPEYGIDKNITFGEVVDQNQGTKQYLGFPYTVLSDLNYNEHKWGLYVNETFSRVIKAFESLKNASDTNNLRSISNNTKIANNFKLITKDLNEFNSLISTSDSYRNKTRINRSFKCKTLKLKHNNSGHIEKIKIIDWRISNFTKNTISGNESILKDNIIQNNHISQNTITFDKLKQPYVRVKEKESWATSENFSNILIPITADKSNDLLFLTRNDQLKDLSPKQRYIKIINEPSEINYKNTSLIIEDNEYIELEKDLNIEIDITKNMLDIKGNRYSINASNDVKLYINKLYISNSILKSDVEIISEFIYIDNIESTNGITISSNNINISNSNISTLTVKLDSSKEIFFNINSSNITNLIIDIKDSSVPAKGIMNIKNYIQDISVIIEEKEYKLEDEKVYSEIKKYFKNINIG